MKKIYLSAFLIGATASVALSQVKTEVYDFGKLNQLTSVVGNQAKPVKPTSIASQKSLIWNEDFDIGTSGGSTAGPTFVTANGTWTAIGDWKHSFSTTNGTWSGNTPAFTSTTASNGFMLFDSDSLNTDWSVSPVAMVANPIGYTGELISPSINLTAETSAQLVIEQDFRWCCSGSHTITVAVSSDGGVTWGTPYDLVPSSVGVNDGFSTTTGGFSYAANISGQAAGNTIQLKFTWDGVGTGNSHYYWNIDDLCILALPADDIQNMASWISGENNGGLEYGRTPEDQQDANWYVGSQVYNFGYNDQTNIMLTADFGSFSSTGTQALLMTDSTTIIESLEALSLTPAVYTGLYTVVSDLETAGGPLFGNNTGGREFEITPASNQANSIYSQDGVGVYSNTSLTSLGSNSFTGAEDGLVCASMYHIKQTSSVAGIRVLLATGTVPNAEIYGSIIDTSNFWADDMTPLFNTAFVTLTSADIAAGYVDLLFPSAISLGNNAYYAAVELFSGGGTNTVRIVDDETVPQPYDASAIYIPGDQSYTNGTALGIRLLMGDFAGISENTLAGVTVYPNPSDGVVTVTNNNASTNTIIVYDMMGKQLFSKEVSASTNIDLSSKGTGIYLVRVSNEYGSMIERVVIK